MKSNFANQLKHVVHPIPPLYNEHSEILILGSFPSVKSREVQFFYGHPQNRFWKLIAQLTCEEFPITVEDKKQMALKHNIALWDTLASCDIVGSSDASIVNAVPNDIAYILNHSAIKRIFTNGQTAHKYYQNYIFPKIQIEDVCLPSTSPANASWNFERLLDAWKIIL